MKKILAFVSFTLLFISACQKDTATTLNAIQLSSEEFTPVNEGVGKTMISDFLSYISTKNNVERNGGGKTEISEALWLLEASANFESNVNLGFEKDVEMLSYEIPIAIYNEGGVGSFSDADLVSKYQDYQNFRGLKENETGLTALAADWKLSLDNPMNSATLKVSLFLGAKMDSSDLISTAPNSLISFNQAAVLIQNEANGLLASNNAGCAPWLPDPNHPWHQYYPNIDALVWNQNLLPSDADKILFGSLGYNTDLDKKDYNTATPTGNPWYIYYDAIAGIYVANNNNFTSGWQSYLNNQNYGLDVQWKLKRIGVGATVIDPVEMPWGTARKTFYLKFILGGAYTYCY